MTDIRELTGEELVTVNGGGSGGIPGPKYRPGQTVRDNSGWRLRILYSLPRKDSHGWFMYYLYTTVIIELPPDYDGFYAVGKEYTVAEDDIIPE